MALSRAEVGAALRAHREAAGLTQVDAARASGVAQPTISRYERGRSEEARPSLANLTALLDAYRVPDNQRGDLLASAHDATGWRRVVLHRADAPRYQREYRDLELRARTIRAFCATIVPGLLQTEDYRRAVLGNHLDEAGRRAWLAARAERAALLDDPSRTFQFVITAGALTWNLPGAAVMAAQLDRLDQVSRLPHVLLGVIGPDQVTGLAVVNNIDLYDRGDGHRRVVIGTSAATAILDDDADIDLHVDLLDRLASLAAWGDDARTELTRIRELYRR